MDYTKCTRFEGFGLTVWADFNAIAIHDALGPVVAFGKVDATHSFLYQRNRGRALLLTPTLEKAIEQGRFVHLNYGPKSSSGDRLIGLLTDAWKIHVADAQRVNVDLMAAKFAEDEIAKLFDSQRG